MMRILKFCFAQLVFIIAVNINILFSLPEQCEETLKKIMFYSANYFYFFGLNIYSCFKLMRASYFQNLYIESF